MPWLKDDLERSVKSLFVNIKKLREFHTRFNLSFLLIGIFHSVTSELPSDNFVIRTMPSASLE